MLVVGVLNFLNQLHYFCPGVGGNFLNIFASALSNFFWFFSGLSLSVSLAVPRQMNDLFFTCRNQC